MKKILIMLCFLASTGALFAQAVSEKIEMKKTAILGFANLGSKSDDSLNIIFAKSLVNFIGRMPRTAIADYDETKTVCESFNYPSGKQIDIKTASKIGTKLGCEQVVYGDFTVDNKAGKVAVNVVIIDVKTGKQLYKQNFNGLTGLDIFDAVDAMIAAVAGKVTGRVIELAKLTVRIDGEGSFKLMLNGKDTQELTKSSGFSESFPAGEAIAVSILGSDGKSVLEQTVTLTKGENRDVAYTAPKVEVAVAGTNQTATQFQTVGTIITVLKSSVLIQQSGKTSVRNDDLLTVADITLIVADKRANYLSCRVVEGKIADIKPGMEVVLKKRQTISPDFKIVAISKDRTYLLDRSGYRIDDDNYPVFFEIPNTNTNLQPFAVFRSSFFSEDFIECSPISFDTNNPPAVGMQVRFKGYDRPVTEIMPILHNTFSMGMVFLVGSTNSSDRLYFGNIIQYTRYIFDWFGLTANIGFCFNSLTPLNTGIIFGGELVFRGTAMGLGISVDLGFSDMFYQGNHNLLYSVGLREEGVTSTMPVGIFVNIYFPVSGNTPGLSTIANLPFTGLDLGFNMNF